MSNDNFLIEGMCFECGYNRATSTNGLCEACAGKWLTESVEWVLDHYSSVLQRLAG